MFSSVIEHFGYTMCAARRRGLRQVPQALAKIFLRLTAVEGWCAGLLAELVSSLVHQNAHMAICGWLEPEEVLQPALSMRRFQQIGAPDHMSEMGLGIINSCCQLVGVEAIAASYDKVFGRSLDASRLLPHQPVAKSL